MDAVDFRVYFGDGASRVEWPGFIKWSAPVDVTPSETLAGGVPAANESNILTVRRLADLAGDAPAERGFWSWEKTADGRYAQKVLTLELVDANDRPVQTYSIKNAFPMKYQGATLNATGNEVAIETIELAHEGFAIR